MDRLSSMRVFQKVIDEGGFAAAGRALDMSPAVVTRLVADLEDHLGTRLLHRTTRRVSPRAAASRALVTMRRLSSTDSTGSSRRTALVETRPAHRTTVSQPAKARDAWARSVRSHWTHRTPSTARTRNTYPPKATTTPAAS